ncbi:MAG: hypothetical protein QG652_1477 [Pseudomonadota bacterium]|nr:hypothetical protein [Pseudomonadota bacterium]
MNNHILVIDQGTHATRALLFSPRGDILAQAEQTVALQRIDHEQVEQDAEEILRSIHQVLSRIGNIPDRTICALTTQRSTTLAWDKTTGKALCPALSWQDRRAQNDLQQFSAHTARIKSITGLPLSAHYGAGKLRWLLAHNNRVQTAAQQNNLCMGPLASFLLWRLLIDNKFCVDISNAHRMLLLDLHSGDWSDELLRIFQIEKKYLPPCLPLQHHYGFLQPYNFPITAVCGDQTAAFHGLGPLPDGTAVVNAGSGAFILAACDRVITGTPLLCGIRAGGWLLEGTVNGAGSALDWAQPQWPVENLFEQLPLWLNTETSPPVFINTVGGLGSPWWSSAIAPHFAGHQDQHPLPARYVAIIESIVFLLQHNLHAMQKHLAIHTLLISGGLSRLDGLCQKLANLSGCKVQRAEVFETTARGAAWLAAGQPADWFGTPASSRVFIPATDTGLQSRFAIFAAALHKLCN